MAQTEMQRAVVLAHTRHKTYWHKLSHEQRRLVLEAVRAEMKAEVRRPQETAEYRAFREAAGRIRLGGIAGALAGERVKK